MPGSDGAAVAVLGAAGTIGPAIVRDLARSEEVGRLLLLDLAAERVEAVALRHGGGLATARVADADEPDRLADIVRAAETRVLVNAAAYRFNLPAMAAALAAGCHYVDLGGLYHTTLRQLAWHGRFAAAGHTAVLGMGASPGKTNLMAALGAAGLDRVDGLHVAAAATDPTPAGDGRLAAPYALETIFDELTAPAIVVRDQVVEEVPALTEGGEIDFPDPVGRRSSRFTLHSELATFPSSFPGLRDASFRLALAPALADRVELLARWGLADLEPLSLADGTTVVPRAVLLAALARHRATVAPSNNTTAVHLVDVEGARDSQPIQLRVAAVTTPHHAWRMGGHVVSTAAPAAEAARRLLRGEVFGPGVLPPEQAFDPGPFLDALAATGCTVTMTVQPD